MELALASFLCLWTAFSIAAQFENSPILQYDFLHLIPTYRFFSPRPVSKDFCIYLKGHEFGCENSWIPLFLNEKKWYNFAWNPQLRLWKSVNDLYDYTMLYKDEPETIHLTLPYLIILNLTYARFADNKNTTHVQFFIGSYAGFEDPQIKILFMSNLHSV